MEPLEILLWVAPVAVSIGIPIIYYAVRINRELYKHGQELEANQHHMNKLHECDTRIEHKIDNYTAKHELEVEKYKTQIERKIDKIEDNMDRMASKTDTILEKVAESEKTFTEIKSIITKQSDFFVDWIQRIEDVTRDNPDFVQRRRKRRHIEDG